MLAGVRTAVLSEGNKLTLDGFSQNDIATAYGLRKLNPISNATRAIRVRESSGNTEKDIGFVGERLDTASLLSHCGANSGYIVTWYDQSGNGNHATMATADNQPRIVNSGVVDVCTTGKPCAVFDGTNDVLSITNSASIDITSQPLVINAVFNNTNQTGWVLNKTEDADNKTQYGLQYNATNISVDYWLQFIKRQVNASLSIPTSTLAVYSCNYDGTTQKAYVNSVQSGTTGTYTGALTSRPNLCIGARSNNAGGTAWTSFFKGNISEIIISKNLSVRSKIEYNQMKYYGTLMLDETGYLPVRMKAGLMDFGLTNNDAVLWVFPDGSTSTAAKPAVTLSSAGIVKCYTNFGKSNLELRDNNTNANYIGNLKDLQGKLTYYLDLFNCSLITGSLADLQGKLTYYLSLSNCPLITGSLADLQGKLTYSLDLSSCSLITGVYTPSGGGTPTTTILTGTGLSTSDIDNTLIAYADATTPKSNGSFTATGKNRTAASDTALTTLTGRGWTISGITKI